MLKRFSNFTLLVFCGLLVVGIVITRRVDTAIETNENRKDAIRSAQRQFEIDCAGGLQPLLVTDTANWVRIEYVLPSFSSYNLDKKGDTWYLGDTPTNVEATALYLGKIAKATYSCRVVYSNPGVLKMPDYELRIFTKESDTILFETYVVDTNYIIQDKNGQLYYGNNDSLFWQLYFGKQRFIPELAEQ